MQAPITITRLSDRPVLGVPMGQVTILRLDQTGGAAPGNKAYKLRENLRLAREEGVRRIVSFGGGWSNHLHALAAVGAELGLETVGLVRGEEGEGDTPTLEDARRWGMEIRRLPRGLYRRRNDPDFIVEIQRQYRPCLVVPEGGANSRAAQLYLYCRPRRRRRRRRRTSQRELARPHRGHHRGGMGGVRRVPLHKRRRSAQRLMSGAELRSGIHTRRATLPASKTEPRAGG